MAASSSSKEEKLPEDPQPSKSPLLQLLDSKDISPQEVLNVLKAFCPQGQGTQEMGSEGDSRSPDWLSRLKYVRFLREVRKRGQISCLPPSLVWSVKERVSDIAEQTMEQALKLSDFDLIKTLAQSGYNINSYRNAGGMSTLQVAVTKRDFRLLKTLFDMGCDFNQTDTNGQTVFSSDPAAGRDILMKSLVDKKLSVPFILKILGCGVDVNAEDDKGQTALFKACQGGNANKRLVKTLLEQGADVHHRDHEGNTPIIVTCRKNHVDVVEVLRAGGANVNDKNKAGMSPIHYAAALHKADLIKFLLKEGATMNDTDADGDTPLVVAIKKSQFQVVEMLLANGALDPGLDLQTPDKILKLLQTRYSLSALLVCTQFVDKDTQQDFGKEVLKIALENEQLSMAYSLLNRGASPDITLSSGQTPLQVAMEANHEALVKKLIQCGALVDQKSVSLLKAAMNLDPSNLQELLQQGADPNEQDAFGETVLHKLAAKAVGIDPRLTEVLECLFAAGADPNIPNKQCETPLHCAVYSEHMSYCLLKYGAKVNACDSKQRTPLILLLCQEPLESSNTDFMAMFHFDLVDKCKVVKVLLQYGADINHTDSAGNCALTLARESKILELLIESGSIANETLSDLLVQAVQKEKFDHVEMLLKHGVDESLVVDKITLRKALDKVSCIVTERFIEMKKEEINGRDEDGRTPLMIASLHIYPDIVNWLIKHGAAVDVDSLLYCPSLECARSLLTAESTRINPCGEEDEPAVKKALLDINKQDPDGKTALSHAASGCGSTDLVNYLLTNNLQQADPNIVDYDNHTALSLASRKGNIPIMELLLQHGADCNIGTSSLIEAFNHGHVDAVEFLLNDERCNPNQTNTFDETLLIIAAQSGAVYKNRVMDMLKTRKDVDVNVGDEHGRSLLHLAAAHKPYLLTRVPFLLNNGADFSRTDAYGRTILHDWEPRTDSLVQLALRQLLKMHIDVNQHDYNGHTAMHLAVMQQDGEMRRRKIRELLKFGVDLSIRDKTGLTVYHLATHDVHLFHILLEHSPQDFQGKALSLIHKMSGWFKTKNRIFSDQQCADTNNSENTTVSDMKAVNVTLHGPNSPSNFARWSQKLADYLCRASHQSALKHMLVENVICSYSEAMMAEIQEKARTVQSLFRDISGEIAKSDKMLEFTPYVAGSCNEGTKVVLPDEMDMLCVLHNFKHLSLNASTVCSSLVHVYLEQPSTERKYSKICREGLYAVEQTRVFNHFYFHFSKALQNQELWKKYPKLYRIQTDDMSHSNQSITDLQLVWHGEHFPFLEFSVDVVPAFNVQGWLPEHVLEHPLVQRNGFLAIPKFRVEHVRSNDITDTFQASFERSEADLFHIMPVELKQAYMLAKIIKSMLPTIENFHAGMFISSYLMKTCTFKIFQNHPEYEQRLEIFIKSDKLSASLTQQPYDPQPLAPVADIIYWCKQIFIRLEEAMTGRCLHSFFLPRYNLLGHNVYRENYRPQLLAQIGRTMLHDPATDPQAWKQLAEAQSWKIAEVGGWDAPQVERDDLCACSRYTCTRYHSRLK